MRLIDADELLTKAKENIFDSSSEVVDAIEDAPTVEPKRGKWIPKPTDTAIIICSSCKNEAFFTDYGQQLFDFCPYCGANMKGDNNE